MTQLIIDLYQHDFNPNVEAESVEAALGQFLAQQDLRFRSVHVQGKAAYVEVADGESVEMAATALDDAVFMDYPIKVTFARSQHSGRNHIDKMEHNDPKYQERGGFRNRRQYRRNSNRSSPPYQHQQQQPHIEQYPCRILIPTKMIKVVLGKGGSTIQKIQESTDTKIDVHREKNKGSEDTITTIKGNPKSFSEACQKILTAIADEMERTELEESKQPQLKILAHDSLCGRLIGKSGANLKRIQEMSGAKVIISNTMFEEFTPFSYSVEPLFSNERVITVEGNLDSICDAEREISRKLRQCMERDMKTLMSNVPYPQGGMGLLNTMPYGHSGLGYGYQTQMGMNPMNQMYPGSPGILNGYPGAVGPNGSPYQMHSGYYGPRSNMEEQVTISIPTRAVGAIIGKKGGHINNMKAYSQAQVRVVKGEEGGESKVEINGTPEAIWKASFCVFSKIREGLRSTLYDAELKTEILVPGNCLGRIIGKKGSVVLSIQDGSGTEIEVPKDKQGGPKAPIYIQGTFSGTQAALARIRSIVSRVQQQEEQK